MSLLKKSITLATIAAIISMGFSTSHLEAVAYVTDTGGYAYDESRAATNLAPAIALGTVAVVGIIAIAVQNTHDHSSSSSSSISSGHFNKNNHKHHRHNHNHRHHHHHKHHHKHHHGHRK